MDKETKILAVVGLISAAFLLGGNLGKYANNPVSAYQRKIEGDSRNYLVIQNSSGRRFPFVEQPNGQYLRLDKAQEAENKGLSKKLTEDLK